MKPETSVVARESQHTASFRAARAVLQEIHFGSERKGCAGSDDPSNAAFLDRRATALSPLIEREFAGTHQALVEALQAIVEITKLPALHPRLSKTTYNELIHHEAEQALRLASGKEGA